MNCPLCSGSGSEYKRFRDSIYYTCSICEAVFLDEHKRLDPESEEKRYRQHNNDVEDPRYIRFVFPITNAIIRDYSTSAAGLDFGAGTGPVITKVLKESGYHVDVYDPIFHRNKEVLNQQFDFIACCEVIEHFFYPKKEFKLLKGLLKKSGKLYCMTEMYDQNEDFYTWHYKDDPTHVVFYTRSTMMWIKENLGFRDVNIENRLITFST